MRLVLLVLGTTLIGFGFGYVTGKDIRHSNVKTRALEINSKKPLKDTIYSQSEVEYIIFGESQL